MERKKRILEKVPQYGKRKLVCGVGVFDAPYVKTKDELTLKAYRHWNNMLQRCYGQSNFPSKPAYKNCSVCEQWYSFLSFRKWFDLNYVEGYCLDKDLLLKGNKIYSPDTCCFVPPFVNTLLLSCKSSRGKYPIGVTGSGKHFCVKIYKYGKSVYVGFFKTTEEAFAAYKQAKEAYIKEVAQKYYDEGKITKRVYNALMKYEVEITD